MSGRLGDTPSVRSLVMKKICFFILLVGSFGFLTLVTSNAHAASIVGVGILGDSASDEYRADDDRGGAYALTTLNWVELLQRYRGVNFGPWGFWGGTRRHGYEYNWARSGATAEEVVTTGQAAGLAQQVAEGQVNTVVLFVGANDFAIWNGTYARIYNGVLKGPTLQHYIHAIVSSYAAAIDTVRAAGGVNMIVVNIYNRSALPYFISQFPDAGKRQRVTDAIKAVNTGIQSIVGRRRGVVLVDLFNGKASPEIAHHIDKNGDVTMGGQVILTRVDGDEPHHAHLADHVHEGTVAEALLANYIFVDSMAKFGVVLQPFSDKEALAYAGIDVKAKTTSASLAETGTNLHRVAHPAILRQQQ